MATILVCDHCQLKIEDGFGSDNLVRIEVQIDKKWYRKSLHKDCFNYMFSTDINRIKGENK